MSRHEPRPVVGPAHTHHHAGGRRSAVSLSHVSTGYNGKPVLEEVSCELPEGEFLALVGPNGGGKSTILKLILGLLDPWEGTVRVFGQPPRQVRHRIGYLPQAQQLDPLFPVTVWDVACMGRLRPSWRPQRLTHHDREAVATALERAELLDQKDRLIGSLSGGQRQRVLLARALASEPELLLLDEPGAGLDPIASAELYDFLATLAGEVTVILSSHDLVAVRRFASWVGAVDRGLVLHYGHHLAALGPADQVPEWAETWAARCRGPWQEGG